MFRTVILCMALLLTAATVAADDAAPAGAPEQSSQMQKEPAASEDNADREKRKADSEATSQDKPQGDVEMSGMSILGNDEAPKSLVIVPWKSSQLGDAPGLSKLLDDSTQPVDKDVFLRELAYYQIRTNSQ
jgi:hypothetical protein